MWDAPHLFERLKAETLAWRKSGYRCRDYPLIGEILAWQSEHSDSDAPTLKYLREPQFLALEVYWYVRLKLRTPKIIDLYKHFYGDDNERFFKALGIKMSADALELADIDVIVKKIKQDENFVRRHKIDALHESVNLDYPSYILALAMGAGKTVLIGAIIATEFAMSLRYPKGNFMKNALVFAPGTTIIESLREISDMPFDKILPPKIYGDFFVNLKIYFPTDSKTIPAQPGSSYNLIVTNTEKISLRAVRRANQSNLDFQHKEAEANLRLLKITSLPKLGIFSDEAHHTYGNTFDKLKRVRQTINYIGEKTDLVAVVNTTGTPYYKSQTLKEVIVWYGLNEGIKDNILKDLYEGIYEYHIQKGQSDKDVFKKTIRTFFESYGEVRLSDGARAKIAFYFKTQEHLNTSRRFIESAMTEIDENITQILVNTQQSGQDEINEFKRLNNPDSQKRVILLIGKGVEGWNCPSLFACALIKEQAASNNYILQAATRCLRQTQGNSHSAKIFLDGRNSRILGRELEANFGTDILRLWQTEKAKKSVTLKILKTELPKLKITQKVQRVERKGEPGGEIMLKKPRGKKPPAILQSIFTPDFSGGASDIFMPAAGAPKKLAASEQMTDCYIAAWKISSRYHLPAMPILEKLQEFYPQGEIPAGHLYDLFMQVERRHADYVTVEQNVTEVMALIRLRDEDGNEIFDKEGKHYVHRLRISEPVYDSMKSRGLLVEKGASADTHNLSFHYTPYNFDSKPESALLTKVLSALKTDPRDVEAFLFTGGLTDTNKTDFHFEYLGVDKRYHRYFPDFVLVKKTGEFYIVEVKSERERGLRAVNAKKKAIEQLQSLQVDKFQYEIIYTPSDSVDAKKIGSIMDWVNS